MPIIFEDSWSVMPFFNPISFKIGLAIKRSNKNACTKINSQNKIVLAVGFSHRKDSINKVKNKYIKPIEKNKIIPLISSFT
jgi:hypothetical protein